MNSEMEGVNLCRGSVWEGSGNSTHTLLILQMCHCLQGICSHLWFKKALIINDRAHYRFNNREAHADVPEHYMNILFPV